MFDYWGQNWAANVADIMKTGMANAVVKLWKAGLITPSMDLTLAELSAASCDFTGYASKTVTVWTGPFNWLGGGSYLDSGLVTWVATAATPFVDNNVGGYWVSDEGGEFLIAVGQLPSAVPIAKEDDVLKLVIQIPYGVPLSFA
jgi:hypothetical protein